jgi:hypothetical protein
MWFDKFIKFHDEVYSDKTVYYFALTIFITTKFNED